MGILAEDISVGVGARCEVVVCVLMDRLGTGYVRAFMRYPDSTMMLCPQNKMPLDESPEDLSELYYY